MASIEKKITNNLGLVFLLMLVTLLILEGLTIQNSVHMILNSNPQVQQVTAKGVRINFDVYNQVTARIDEAAVFQPSRAQLNNPFTPFTAPPPTP